MGVRRMGSVGASGGAGGGLDLVEEIVTAAGDAGVDFLGLTAGTYRLIGDVKTTSTSRIFIDFNGGIAGSKHSVERAVSGTGSASGTAWSTPVIARTPGDRLAFEAVISAEEGVPKSFWSQAVSPILTGDVTGFLHWGMFADTSDLTQINLSLFGAPTEFSPSSVLRLYRMGVA